MSNLDSALPALCRYIKLLIHVDLTPDHLELAKHNIPDRNTVETLWRTLKILSYYAVRETSYGHDIDFRDYDMTGVKLHFAFLNYQSIEFYGLLPSDKSSRTLLIALAWLLITQDILSVIFEIKRVCSELGRECSHTNPSEDSESTPLNLIKRNKPKSSNDRDTNSVYEAQLKINKVESRIKRISELMCEKTRRITRIHAASKNVSGLPHLNVSELALMKCLTMNIIDEDDNKSRNSEENRRLRLYRDLGILFDARMKWLPKKNVFFNWMVSAIEDHQASVKLSNSRMKDLDFYEEVARFTYVMRHIMEKRFQRSASEDPKGVNFKYWSRTCPSRAYRSQCENTEADHWSTAVNELLKQENDILDIQRKQLICELTDMLKHMKSVHI